MTVKNNPYTTLGVASNASADEIRSVYRDIAVKELPRNYFEDVEAGKSPVVSARYQAAYDAYAQLIDPQKRTIIDIKLAGGTQPIPPYKGPKEQKSGSMASQAALPTRAGHTANGLTLSPRDMALLALDQKVLAMCREVQTKQSLHMNRSFHPCPNPGDIPKVLTELKRDRYSREGGLLVNPLVGGSQSEPISSKQVRVGNGQLAIFTRLGKVYVGCQPGVYSRTPKLMTKLVGVFGDDENIHIGNLTIFANKSGKDVARVTYGGLRPYVVKEPFVIYSDDAQVTFERERHAPLE